MGRAPAAFGLEDVAPEVGLAEDSAHRARLVAAAGVRQSVGGIARGMEAAVALVAGHGMCRDRQRERLVVTPALGEGRPAVRPHQVVQHRGEAQPGPGLGHDPRAPAGDDATALANWATGLHQRALARRRSAGWITSSTSP